MPRGIRTSTRTGKTGAMRKKLKQVAKKSYVKNMINRRIETKYASTREHGILIDAPVAGAGNCNAYFSLSDTIALGTSDTNQRVGDKITMASLKIRFQIQLANNLTGADQNQFIRCVIFQWHDAVDTGGNSGQALNGILPVTDIFQLGSDGANVSVNSHYRHDRKSEYRILYDKHFEMVSGLNANPTAGNVSVLKYVTKTISLRKARRVIKYINGSTTNAMNHLFFIAMSNNGTSVNNPPLYFSSMLTYRDA